MPSPSINKLPIFWAFPVPNLEVMVGGGSEHSSILEIVMQGLKYVIMTVSEGARSVHHVRPQA